MAWEYLGESGELPDRGPTNPRFRAAIQLWTKLPLGLANWLGPIVVRNIP